MKSRLFFTIFVFLCFCPDSTSAEQTEEVEPIQIRPREEVFSKEANNQIGQVSEAIDGMVYVKGGCFEMGDRFGDGALDEKPVHDVCIDDFYIGRTEVSQGEWKKIMGNNPSEFKECGETCPVESVSLDDIQKYIEKVSKQTGRKFRLPTEAEWEYAATSGGRKERWAGTIIESTIGEYAWFGDNSEGKVHPTAQKKPNGFGLYDMSGNVWEWVNDYYDKDYYKDSPKDNPQGPLSIGDRVLRGGSWYASAKTLRLTYRFVTEPMEGDGLTGFRLALDKN